MLHFLDGESLDITDNGRKYEMLTFGRSGLPSFNSFDEAFDYLSGEGLPAIAEHPLAQGHYGPIDLIHFYELCRAGKYTAIEHNAKISVPNIFSGIPFKIINGHTIEKNEDAAGVARAHHIPLIANDDSEFPFHINAAYNIFPRNKISMVNGDAIKDSLVTLIGNNDFEIYPGHIGGYQFFRFAGISIRLFCL